MRDPVTLPRDQLNSVLITVPTVIGGVARSAMTGFALGIYRFRYNVRIFVLFDAGNSVPFQILMVPVLDLTLDLGLRKTKTGLVLFHTAFQAGFCTRFMPDFIRPLAVRVDHSRAGQRRQRKSLFSVARSAACENGAGRQSFQTRAAMTAPPT